MRPKPRTKRAVLRSLVWEITPEGQHIAGSKWFQTRVMGTSRQQVEACVLSIWANGEPS